MKKKLLIIITAVILFFFPKINFGQAPTMATTVNFALFSSIGAVTNAGTTYLTHITGNVGTNSDPTIPGFGNVDGQMHYVGDAASTKCAADLLVAYNQLNATVPTFFPANLMGNGQVLAPGVYSVNGATTLNLDLTFDAKGDPTAVFIVQIQGTFSTNANSKVKLINGALACNVFWKIDGAIGMGTGTTMRGSILANAAITMTTGDTLEGRALTNNGAVGVSGVLVYTPIGCGSPLLTGPTAPTLATTACYELFSSIGPVTNFAGSITNVTGDVGTNSGTTTGFNPLLVNGSIHPVPDGSTGQCKTDLDAVYLYLNGLPYDIELLFPAQFGHNLVLTPHTYIMKAAVTFTDTLYLNGQGNANAIFVIQVNGAFGSTVNSRVVLTNGTQAKNVYWKIDGAVTISDNSIFNGTIISQGAIDLKTGVAINGRALTVVGALTVKAITAISPNAPAAPAGAISGPTSVCKGQTGVVYSVPAIGNATSYTWTLPAGATISAGVNTNSITVDFSATATSGNITVQGASICGNGTVSPNLAVTVNPIPTVNGVPNQTVCNNAPTTAIIFSGSVAGTTYLWTNTNTTIGLAASGSGNISSFIATNSTINAVTATITVTPTANGCTGTSTNFTITVNPFPAPAGIITGPSTVCQGQTGAIFTVPAIINATGYIWILPAGATITAGNNTNSITASFSLTAVGGNITVQGSNACGNGIVSPNFVLSMSSSPAAAAGIISGPASVCQGQTGVVYSVPVIANATNYAWTLPVGVTITAGTNTNSITVDFSLTALNGNITVQGSNGCGNGAVSPNFAVIVNPIPTVNGVPNQTVCNNAPTTAITFSGAVAGTTYIWTNSNTTIGLAGSGSGNISSFTATNSTATIVTATITVTPTANGCTGSSTSFTITVNPTPTVNVVTNQTVCNNAPTSAITFSGGVAGTSYTWTNSNTSIGLAGSGSGNISSFSATNSTATIVTATITVTPSANGCTGATTSFTITVNPTPTVNSGTNQVLCDNSITAPVINWFSGGVVGTTYAWTNSNTTIGLAGSGSGDINSFTATNKGAVAVTATITVTPAANGCTGASTSFTITVNPLPVAAANSNTPVCLGSPINLSASTVAGGTYSWTGPNGYTSSVQNPVIPSAAISNAGKYSLTVLVNGCTSAPSNVTVVVNNCGGGADLSVVKTVNDIHPFIGHTIVFTITATNNGPSDATGVIINDLLKSGYTNVSTSTTAGTYNSSTGVWLIGNLKNGASEILKITATVNTSGNYFNSATIQGNETDGNMANNVSSTTTFPTDFNIPEGFSPNNDGINDLFVIRGIQNYPANTFLIFNRWGDKIFDATSYQNTWDGKSTIGVRVGGDDLPIGTYFYILDLGDGSNVFKGTIYLTR